MKRVGMELLVWSVVTLVLAASFHAVWVWHLPSFVTSNVIERARNEDPTVEFNHLYHGTLRYAGTDTIVRDNPDTVTSLGVYDVSDRPLRIHSVIPDTENYWSLSLFAWNTDNFYVVNDRTATAGEFDVIVVRPDGRYQALAGEEIVVSPSDRGIVIVRLIVTDRHDTEELKRISDVQRLSFMAPIPEVQH